LLYPIATIFLIWAVSGHVGPAEAALHLPPNLSGWQRGVATASVGFMYASLQWFRYNLSWLRALLGVTVAVTVALALVSAGVLASPVFIAACGAVNIALFGAGAVAIGAPAVVSIVSIPLIITALPT
jgi:hypothetical protein